MHSFSLRADCETLRVMNTPKLLPLGPDGILVQFADQLSDFANQAAIAFSAALEAEALTGVVETATSLASVYVRFRPDQVSRHHVIDGIKPLLDSQDWYAARLPAGRSVWHVPVAFEGEHAPDLAEVAALSGLTSAEVVALVTKTPLRVLALGFAPGQPYLGFLPKSLDIPRRTEITPKVPQGAVVLAVRQVIPFANAAPTGWRQIGRTALRCYDNTRDPEFAFVAGDEVQFQAVSANDLAALDRHSMGGAERVGQT